MSDVKTQLARGSMTTATRSSSSCAPRSREEPEPAGDTTWRGPRHALPRSERLPFRVIRAAATMPNIVGSFDTGSLHHSLLNGHMDVFPPTRRPRMDTGSWGGAIAAERSTDAAWPT